MEPSKTSFGTCWSRGATNVPKDKRFDMLTAEEQQQKQEIDSLLLDAMNDLTFEEQQEQLEGLHGVARPLAEEPETVAKALQLLDDQLNAVKGGSAYEAAEALSKKYVSANAFRMMFLRANGLDAQAAAGQMLRFFEAKQKLFGDEKLVTDISMKDLDEDDLACLRTGSMQLSGKDQANRQIFFQVPGLRSYKTLENELRARYYVTMQALQSEEVQLNGAVAIRYSVGHLKDTKNGEGYLDHIRLRKALPIRYEGIHVCCDDPRQILFASVALSVLGSKLRARYKMHLGSHLECLYCLATYGISSKTLPLTPETFQINLQYHQNWFQSCLFGDMRPQTTADHPPMLTTETTVNDALFICCKKSRTLGNDRLRVLVQEMSELYDLGNNEKKKRIADQIVEEIQEQGGNFLQHVKGSVAVYEILPPKEIRAKITQIFRNHRRAHSKLKVQERAVIVGNPLPNDVVFGRMERNEGTTLLYSLIKDRFNEYESLDRGSKLTVVDAIIDQLKSQGSRFLQSNEQHQEYLELSDELVRNRVSKYFRNHRRLVRKNSIS